MLILMANKPQEVAIHSQIQHQLQIDQIKDIKFNHWQCSKSYNKFESIVNQLPTEVALQVFEMVMAKDVFEFLEMLSPSDSHFLHSDLGGGGSHVHDSVRSASDGYQEDKNKLMSQLLQSLLRGCTLRVSPAGYDITDHKHGIERTRISDRTLNLIMDPLNCFFVKYIFLDYKLSIPTSFPTWLENINKYEGICFNQSEILRYLPSVCISRIVEINTWVRKPLLSLFETIRNKWKLAETYNLKKCVYNFPNVVETKLLEMYLQCSSLQYLKFELDSLSFLKNSTETLDYLFSLTKFNKLNIDVEIDQYCWLDTRLRQKLPQLVCSLGTFIRFLKVTVGTTDCNWNCSIISKLENLKFLRLYYMQPNSCEYGNLKSFTLETLFISARHSKLNLDIAGLCSLRIIDLSYCCLSSEMVESIPDSVTIISFLGCEFESKQINLPVSLRSLTLWYISKLKTVPEITNFNQLDQLTDLKLISVESKVANRILSSAPTNLSSLKLACWSNSLTYDFDEESEINLTNLQHLYSLDLEIDSHHETNFIHLNMLPPNLIDFKIHHIFKEVSTGISDIDIQLTFRFTELSNTRNLGTLQMMDNMTGYSSQSSMSIPSSFRHHSCSYSLPVLLLDYLNFSIVEKFDMVVNKGLFELCLFGDLPENVTNFNVYPVKLHHSKFNFGCFVCVSHVTENMKKCGFASLLIDDQ
ncbi:unnamed protein product [Ambrosiozyma monospora]|uniref:Unnamed protein product n=1 Tax=Ambrosiozyma monospora TaxID=43982 RepID=A0A9W7DD90_AMBMO|nr:unnamed protein product [Ambrosiozyma monospora]